MFGEIMRTLVRIVMLFLFLMVAFGLGFHALMLNQVGNQPDLSGIRKYHHERAQGNHNKQT
jgi:hypothetical protein